jgi:hypothetical protein
MAAAGSRCQNMFALEVRKKRVVEVHDVALLM